ncbi:MAG: glycosyltransferase family 4 protein, partial [Leptolyngbyaceae cyanobacterium SL_7_1]|nr:glycosyltransferase family 4 protein [Leptolyngbyaceae cyanobacterium SL_7_1]
KGLPILFDSLVQIKRSLPDVVLTVVGDGSDRALLEARVQQLGLEETVQFVGYRSQAEVRACLQETDVFVLPSFAEGVPVVLMEAMAAAVPVVATRIAGIAELVEDGESGYLVPPGDAMALAAAIEALLLDGERRSQFGRAGRATVEQAFNIHHEVAQLSRLFTSSSPTPMAFDSFTSGEIKTLESV